jgi:hypothetical protein
LENFSENRTQPKRRRGRPRLFVGQPTRNEQNLAYTQVAKSVLSKEGRFDWILKSKTLLTEIGRFHDPASMIEIADAIDNERRTLPNGKAWPTAQMLRRIVQQCCVGKNSAGECEDLIKELEALIQDYRERHPKFEKA